jgi:hypothetical protein
MFRLLVTADLVIADVSLHNPNVFYELGIRHGLQQRHTFLLREKSTADLYPFDLQTDRYFVYDHANLGQQRRSARRGVALDAWRRPEPQRQSRLPASSRAEAA